MGVLKRSRRSPQFEGRALWRVPSGGGLILRGSNVCRFGLDLTLMKRNPRSFYEVSLFIYGSTIF
jgi:hypothetical protein